ncbi:MAG TPA: transcription termination factor NusA [Candidatus Absconditabacterales bacterium]|nr:transcription termination factor NusA [Candidatus Absconditabacterales bacterium]HPK28224.1 transcription termination factor NusA [Candidatus Absconditabacterales bacterium]
MKLDGKSIQVAIAQLVEDYKFDAFQIFEIVKMGIRSGFRKDYPEHKKANIAISIDNEGNVKVYKQLLVKKEDEIEDEDTEIGLKAAKEIRKDIKEGEELLIDVTPKSMELSRIASQAAAQTIKQQLKNVEREKFFEKFQNKEGELLKAKVIRVHADSVILDIEGAAVVLLPDGQIPNRMYEPGEEVFVLLKQISKDSGGIMLNITQSSPDYIEAILRKIVPELEEGLVIIEKVVRVPGKKTKIMVSSTDEKIDPVGVMVGHKGDRINTVLSLLDGEKIDYIEKIEDPIKLITACLKPAQIDNIEIKDKKAYITLDESQKALAIGRGASNIRLASQITGYAIELK